MVKYIDLKEFREQGYLQEVNRQFLHPLGLALEIRVDDEGNETLGGIWDYRDDADGMAFVDLTSEDHKSRYQNVQNQLADKALARKEKYGWEIQPVGSTIDV